MSRPIHDTVPAAHVLDEGDQVLILDGPPRRGRGALLWRDSSAGFDKTHPASAVAAGAATAADSVMPPLRRLPPNLPIRLAAPPARLRLSTVLLIAWAIGATIAALL